MATKLLIVESPGKVKKLSQILGSDWLVKASMGHVRELAEDGEDSLGFSLDGDSVRCHFVARGTRGKETIQHLLSAVQRVKSVVLATDLDREGETIAWHLEQALKLRNPQRVVYTEITPTAIDAAISTRPTWIGRMGCIPTARRRWTTGRAKARAVSAAASSP